MADAHLNHGSAPTRGEHPARPQSLEALAEQLAPQHTRASRSVKGTLAPARLNAQEGFFKRAYQQFLDDTRGERMLPAAGEWVLDNLYVIQQAVRQVREDMPAGFYDRLPKLDTPDAAGLPRVYEIARALVEHENGRLDFDHVTQFLHCYQETTPLTTAEVWALPVMLRLALLDLLTQAVGRAVAPGVPAPPASAFSVTLPADAADDVLVGNGIRSLRGIAALDWDAFFEQISPLEAVLRGDPSGVYVDMDFDTRDRYRQAVEELAWSGEHNEADVAYEVIRLAAEAGRDHAQPECSKHVGYYLVDDGRADLEAALGWRPPASAAARRWLRKHATAAYLGSIAFLTFAISLGPVAYGLAAGASPVLAALIWLLTLIPASFLSVSLVNLLVTHIMSPRILPKMDYREGVPADCAAMVVIPALLTNAEEVRSLLRQLEVHYLGNRDPHLRFALITDFTDAPQEHMPGDGALVEAAVRGVEALNRRYGDETERPFCLFHRRRQWNSVEQVWMGWERKRGKLAEFNRLLAGDDGTSYSVRMADPNVLAQVRYVVTLDADTALPREAARQLIATLAHPLNRAEFGPDEQRPRRGYTILQPRTEVKPTSAARTRFTRLYAGDQGVDLYTRAVSDVYQDLLGDANYVGKGIYDVAAFQRSLQGCVPENTLLSHDLFEGMHGRVGLVTDVVLYEDYPSNYLAFAQRLHRWVRGDWQLLPWLLPGMRRTNNDQTQRTFTGLNTWKMVDNLRRSMRAPSLLVMLAAGWLRLPGSPFVWTLFGLGASAAPMLSEVAAGLIGSMRARKGGPDWTGARLHLGRWLMSIVLLPYETLLMLHAIGLTLVRLFITHRGLLQWTTAARTARIYSQTDRPFVTWYHMAGGVLVSIGLTAAIALLEPAALPAAALFLLAWLVSPQITHWLDQTPVSREIPLDVQQQERLQRLARRTWAYFERYTGPDDHWLPPDHFQEHPRGLIAHHTSPTNIGLLLLSTLGAHDLGYVSVLRLAYRLHAAFESMDKLERYRGHYMNWYDTRDLRTLSPRYVSTVDSGNLAASLLALRQGLLGVIAHPLPRWEHWRGLCDTLQVLVETIQRYRGQTPDEAIAPMLAFAAQVCHDINKVQHDPESQARLLRELGGSGTHTLNSLLGALVEDCGSEFGAAGLQELRFWRERSVWHITTMVDEHDRLLPWLAALASPPPLFGTGQPRPELTEAWQGLRQSLPARVALREIPGVCQAGLASLARLQSMLGQDKDGQDAAAAWCADLTDKLNAASAEAGELLASYQQLIDRAEAGFQEMDFSFLFDRRQEVFHLGYDLSTERLDANHYDLFASEARLTSLVAIAKGEAPQSHWLHLDRPLAEVEGLPVLLSWNGSMFEYLMPSLLANETTGLFIGQALRGAVQRQITYARHRGVPWGISESGYYSFDAAMNYQYRGFGVPGLGRKRGLDDDLVIAPYASLLALTIDPQAVLANLDRLTGLGILGQYGLYEAIDYTRARLPLGEDRAVVRSYMAHHQGMIVVSLVNQLLDSSMIRRFHNDPRIQSVELLLQEQLRQTPTFEELPELAASAAPIEHHSVELNSWQADLDGPPQVHVLANGRYSVVLTAAGGGYSAYHDLDSDASASILLTRWRADATRDAWGSWIYVRDLEDGELWSTACQPVACASAQHETYFGPELAEFQRWHHDIHVRTEVAVSPTDDVEVRRVTVTNHSDRERRLSLTSGAEVALSALGADRRHPAFSKMFVQSAYVASEHALLFWRRPREAEEQPLYLAHFLALDEDLTAKGGFETSRAAFLGRGGTFARPAALDGGGGQLSGTTGATLDPIMALEHELTLPPHASAQVAFVTAVAPSRAAAVELARTYNRLPAANRVFEQARIAGEADLNRRRLGTDRLALGQQLLSTLLYPSAGLRAESSVLAANTLGQSGLWPHAISGDYPILLLRIHELDQLGLVQEVLQFHAYWWDRQIPVDLVVINERDVGYAQSLHQRLTQLLIRTGSQKWLGQRGGVFLMRGDQLDEAARTLLLTAARAVVDGDRGPLEQQIAAARVRPTWLPRLEPSPAAPFPPEPMPALERPRDLLFDNGLGGFSAGGREYVIYLEPGRTTPAPWINVIANPDFGFIVSETGLGSTWALNSGENRLTPWRNDPVTDMPAEAIYLRDEETVEVWTPTPLPTGEPTPYLVRHGAGHSEFEHHSRGLIQHVRVYAAAHDPVKIVRLRVHNTLDRPRRVTATYYAEWVLGATRDESLPYIVTEFDGERRTLLARNTYHAELPEHTAFVTASLPLHGLTADRLEFLGLRGEMRQPAALKRVGLGGTVGAGLDPCAALQVHLDLPPDGSEDVYFVLGQGATRDEALALAERFQEPTAAEAAWDDSCRFWDDLLDTISVDTPDPAMNLLLNRWLLYQDLSCRIWGRSAHYQSSGAYGFRDQLQDVLAVLHAAPKVARTHILRAASRQFEQGDVLHWWHPPSGRGVRTRVADDALWLPFVVAQYVEATGDRAILDEPIPFLSAEPLRPDENERYALYPSTPDSRSLYEHCCRAADRAQRVGMRGLPLMGTGDWNDGMNRVGAEGRGESVWLGWFAYAALTRFADVCESRGDADHAAEYRQQAQVLQAALEAHAWDGQWYVRAFFDDGAALGAAQSRECQIDSIAQSWSVLSGAADRARAAQAMEAVNERLVQPAQQLLLLLKPPFDRTARDPGYIKGYPPGIRENGGQYTHAALWAVWAFAKLGQGDRAHDLFRMLNPIHHAATPDDVARYHVEPYVVAADVYSAAAHVGRGGWTWYTGSAGWMYRLGIEAILGLHRSGDTLKITPCIPADWPRYALTYRFGRSELHIEVSNPSGANRGVATVHLDGRLLPDGRIPLADDGLSHTVQVVLGRRNA